MFTPHALVLTGFGINCDLETETAFRRAGASAERVHLNDLIAGPSALRESNILAVPGGFSFGDDVASGRIFANRLRYKLGDALKEFVDDGNLVIGICNGFQVIAKMGLLPYREGELVQEVTLTHNDSGKFGNRWICLKKEPNTVCVWLDGVEEIEMPVRNGEGKFIPRDDALLRDLERRGQVAVRYVKPDGTPARGEYPHNPNGSVGDIAGICDPSGRVFGLMPHPEAHQFPTNHPRWAREGLAEEGAGLAVFTSAVRYLQTLSVVAAK